MGGRRAGVVFKDKSYTHPRIKLKHSFEVRTTMPLQRVWNTEFELANLAWHDEGKLTRCPNYS